MASVSGFDEFLKKLDGLTGKELIRVTSRSTRKALSETRKKAKIYARSLDDPNTSNSIEKNIATKISTKRFRSKGIIKGSVGVRGGAKKGNAGKFGDTYYWRFLELGTSKMPARPFLRPAFDSDEVTKSFSKLMSAEIKKEVNKR